MRIFVTAKPNAKADAVRRIDAMHFEISVKSPAKEDKANLAVLCALAAHLKIPRNRIRIVAGRTSKQKVFNIVE